MKTLIGRSASWSIAFSTVTATAATVWDWLQNPNSIFHNELGTDWKIVFDTAVSWFFPTLLYSFVFIFIFALSLRFLRTKLSRRHTSDLKPKKKQH